MMRRADAPPAARRRWLWQDAVAACSALMAMESGFNVALMTPTEILAEQHFQNFHALARTARRARGVANGR